MLHITDGDVYLVVGTGYQGLLIDKSKGLALSFVILNSSTCIVGFYMPLHTLLDASKNPKPFKNLNSLR